MITGPVVKTGTSACPSVGSFFEVCGTSISDLDIVRSNADLISELAGAREFRSANPGSGGRNWRVALSVKGVEACAVGLGGEIPNRSDAGGTSCLVLIIDSTAV
jgi:hypothetical protein